MSDGYRAISETEHVLAAQSQYGSRAARSRGHDGQPAEGGEPRDALGLEERDFLSRRDGF